MRFFFRFRGFFFGRRFTGLGLDFDTEQHSELHYWRKHPDLHGWMEKLYREKGGAAQSFNCVRMVLAATDLDRLEADIKESRLPDTEGFFFGDSDGSETTDIAPDSKRAARTAPASSSSA
jgi:hypothetical protein